MSSTKSELPTRESLRSGGLDKFNLGQLLPYMEKRYWIFIDSAAVDRAKNGRDLYAAIYFLYEFPSGGKGGYGMISQFDSKSNSFVPKDMWVDQDASLQKIV